MTHIVQYPLILQLRTVYILLYYLHITLVKLCKLKLCKSSYFHLIKSLLITYFIAVQLLHKYGVRASDGPMKLLKVIKNPVTNHLPVGCRKILMSFNASEVLNPRELVPAEDPIAIVIGAMAHGQVSY